MSPIRPLRPVFIVLVAIAILCGGAVTLKRIVLQRADLAALASRGLQAGEMVYLVNADGSVTLRVGDGATVYGRVPIDPATVRIAAQRVLDPLTGYYVETFGGVTANADGSYSMGVAAIAATGGVRVVAINPDVTLSAITIDSAVQDAGNPPKVPSISMSPDNLIDASTNSVTITATPDGDAWLNLSNLVVSAWVDRTPMGATNDFRQDLVHVADATLASSPTTLGQMQTWLNNNEGKHWSLWPALGHVYLAGYQLISGTNGWTIGSHSNNLVIAHAGHRIATFYEATDTNACPSILAATKNTNGTFSIWVDATTAATRAPEVASTVSIATPVAWMPYATSSNSWPATVSLSGTNCYYLVCPSPESSLFFKVFTERATTTPASLDVRSLTVGDTNLTTLLAQKLGTNGGRLSAGLFSDVDYLSTAPASDELPTAEWVRSLQASGKTIYMTTNLYGASWTPTNTTGIGSYDTQSATSMVFTVGTAGTYIATMVDTNIVAAGVPLTGPATIHVHLTIGSGSPAANYSLSVKPELYYVYSLSTNELTLGDFDADPQTWTSGQSVGKTFALAWSTVTPSVPYYRVYRLKVTAKGSSINTVTMGVGGTDASYVTFQTTGEDASAVAADLATHEALSKHTTFGASDIAAAGGVTNGMPMNLTMTNGTVQADGKLNGTNGVFLVFAGSTNRYWILGGE